MTRSSAILVANPGGGVEAIIARYVETGGPYDRDMSLVAEVDMIEFYDPRFAHETLEGGLKGQFITRYNMETLREHVGGINLDGGVDAWKLSESGFNNSMAALAPVACEVVAARLVESLDEDEVFDLASSLVEEMAARRGITGGDETADFRAKVMEGFKPEAEDLCRMMLAADFRADTAHLTEHNALARPAPDMGL